MAEDPEIDIFPQFPASGTSKKSGKSLPLNLTQLATAGYFLWERGARRFWCHAEIPKQQMHRNTLTVVFAAACGLILWGSASSAQAGFIVAQVDAGRGEEALNFGGPSPFFVMMLTTPPMAASP